MTIPTPAPGSETQPSAVPQGETPLTTPVPPGETPASTTTTPTDDIAKELADLKAALKKANAEAATHRHKAAELDKLKAETEAAKLSETEKLQKKIADLQKAHDDALRTAQEARISSAVQVHAARLGFADPDDAGRFVDLAELNFDEQGQPTNVKELLEKLIKAKPYLAGKPVPPTSGGATNPSRSASSIPQTITKEYVSQIMSGGQAAWGKLSPEEQQRISAFIKQGGLFRR